MTTTDTKPIECVTPDGQPLRLEFAGVYDIPGDVTIAYEDDERAQRPDARPLFAIAEGDGSGA